MRNSNLPPIQQTPFNQIQNSFNPQQQQPFNNMQYYNPQQQQQIPGLNQPPTQYNPNIQYYSPQNQQQQNQQYQQQQLLFQQQQFQQQQIQQQMPQQQQIPGYHHPQYVPGLTPPQQNPPQQFQQQVANIQSPIISRQQQQTPNISLGQYQQPTEYTPQLINYQQQQNVNPVDLNPLRNNDDFHKLLSNNNQNNEENDLPPVPNNENIANLLKKVYRPKEKEKEEKEVEEIEEKPKKEKKKRVLSAKVKKEKEKENEKKVEKKKVDKAKIDLEREKFTNDVASRMKLLEEKRLEELQKKAEERERRIKEKSKVNKEVTPLKPPPKIIQKQSSPQHKERDIVRPAIIIDHANYQDNYNNIRKSPSHEIIRDNSPVIVSPSLQGKFGGNIKPIIPKPSRIPKPPTRDRPNSKPLKLNIRESPKKTKININSQDSGEISPIISPRKAAPSYEELAYMCEVYLII